MSRESVPSKPFQIIDLPEVSDVEASSVYNFYVNDEMINESGESAVNGNVSLNLQEKGTANTANINARTPRYIKLSFAVEDTKKSILGKKSRSIKTNPAEVYSALAKGEVYTEEATAGTGFTNYVFSQENIKTDLAEFWSRKFQSLGPDFDEATTLDMLEEVQQESTEPSSSMLESMIPPNLNANNRNFLRNESKHYMVAMLNTSYAPYMLKREVVKGAGLASSENLSRFLAAVNSSSEDMDRYVSDDEYLFDVPLSNISIAPADFIAEAEVVGYLFEKERLFRGRSYKMPPIFVQGSSIREAYDSQVAYGQRYRYRARSIAKFRVPVTDWESGRTYVGEFFFASRSSSPVTAKISEDVRPDPPSDVSYHYDYGEDNLLITWSPPVNPQRDVKYIQVFRRKDVNEPFELLAHYDFDDSVIVKKSKENITSGLVIESEAMPTYYVDADFDRTKSFIYAIVCIDARQNSSYYSTQTRVSYDETTHKIKREFISYQGAPKQYPNWFLKQNFFPDSIKDSSHENVKIYFNPEAYTLLRSSGERIPAFFSTDLDPSAKYLFQFINVDRLAEHQIDIQIQKSRSLIRSNSSESKNQDMRNLSDIAQRIEDKESFNKAVKSLSPKERAEMKKLLNL